MLAKINLLPWRDLQLKAKRRRFLSLVFGCFSCALMIQVGIGAYLESQHVSQKQKLALLNTHLGELENKLAEVERLTSAQQNVQLKLNWFRQLQWQRNKTTLLMTLLTELVPEEVYLDQVEVHDQRVVLKGVGRTTTQLALLLEQFERSLLVKELVMHSIKHNQPRFGEHYQVFHLSFELPMAGEGSRHEP